MQKRSSTESIGEVIHKEKKQKKYNKTTGHFDNLEKYTNDNAESMGQSDKMATSHQQIKREANYMKNIHIDTVYSQLRVAGLITNDKYKAWWCGTMHKLGVEHVKMQADRCLNGSDVKNPPWLFHHLINRELNRVTDPFMPRFK
jgi:hypothetical protein